MADYIEVKAFFFGNEAEKEQVYLNFILPFFHRSLVVFMQSGDGPEDRTFELYCQKVIQV